MGDVALLRPSVAIYFTLFKGFQAGCRSFCKLYHWPKHMHATDIVVIFSLVSFLPLLFYFSQFEIVYVLGVKLIITNVPLRIECICINVPLNNKVEN